MFKFCYTSLLCALIQDTVVHYVTLLHKHYKSLTFMTITRRTQCFLKTKHFCCAVHIFVCMSYIIGYTTLLKKNNTCEITHFYHCTVKVFALLGCCVAQARSGLWVKQLKLEQRYFPTTSVTKNHLMPHNIPEAQRPERHIFQQSNITSFIF